jgi:hypothetical protein
MKGSVDLKPAASLSPNPQLDPPFLVALSSRHGLETALSGDNKNLRRFGRVLSQDEQPGDALLPRGGEEMQMLYVRNVK